ncbi:unnamed protein product, partial [Rotaria sordida]
MREHVVGGNVLVGFDEDIWMLSFKHLRFLITARDNKFTDTTPDGQQVQ